MKRVTNEAFVELRKWRPRWFPSTTLAMHWSVLLDAPTMDDLFREMPQYPEDDEKAIAETRRAESSR